MKYLFILLFFFSTHSFSGELSNKTLVCIDKVKYKNNDIDKSDYIFGYVFKDDSADYYYNTVNNKGLYNTNNISKIKYNISFKFIIIQLEYGNLFINRKTLDHVYNNSITATCEIVKNQQFFFDLLEERKTLLNNSVKSRK